MAYMTCTWLPAMTHEVLLVILRDELTLMLQGRGTINSTVAEGRVIKI
jgi:hypothetical protein